MHELISVSLDNETMLILADIRTREKSDEEIRNRQKQKLEKALIKGGIFGINGAEEENSEIDSMSQIIMETYLKSPVRLVVEFHKADCIVKRGYYFSDDMIVMLNAYRDGGELMWLPSIKLLIGSIADMIGDQPIECENEEFEGIFSAYCNEENYTEALLDSVTEEKYRQLLQEEQLQNPHLQMNGLSSSEENKCFIYVVFKNQSAFYFRQEENKFNYGSANRPTIVNILGNWMLCQHCNLIMKMQGEEGENVL